jgi:hypothetical protein
MFLAETQGLVLETCGGNDPKTDKSWNRPQRSRAGNLHGGNLGNPRWITSKFGLKEKTLEIGGNLQISEGPSGVSVRSKGGRSPPEIATLIPPWLQSPVCIVINKPDLVQPSPTLVSDLKVIGRRE